LSRSAHFEIGIDDHGRNFTIYKLENAKISLIGYSDLRDRPPLPELQPPSPSSVSSDAANPPDTRQCPCS